MLHKEVVSKETYELIETLMKDIDLKDFFLGGDTSLCLRYGHRKSEGIELFTIGNFDAQKLARHMQKTYEAEIRKIYIGSVRCFIKNIPVELSYHGRIEAVP